MHARRKDSMDYQAPGPRAYALGYLRTSSGLQATVQRLTGASTRPVAARRISPYLLHARRLSTMLSPTKPCWAFPTLPLLHHFDPRRNSE